jgi:hypothetical protein
MKRKFRERKWARLSVVAVKVGSGNSKGGCSLETLIRKKWYAGKLRIKFKTKELETDLSKRKLISLLRLTKSRSLQITEDEKYVSAHDRKRTKNCEGKVLVSM